MKFVKLTSVTGGASQERPTFVNLELVQWMERRPASSASTYSPEMPERTMLWFRTATDTPFDGWDRKEVLETPEQILALGDPESACLEPENCSYVSHYLAYGGPDLTHAGYHAAEKLGERHMVNCRLMERTGSCASCAEWERRLRA